VLVGGFLPSCASHSSTKKNTFQRGIIGGREMYLQNAGKKGTDFRSFVHREASPTEAMLRRNAESSPLRKGRGKQSRKGKRRACHLLGIPRVGRNDGTSERIRQERHSPAPGGETGRGGKGGENRDIRPSALLKNACRYPKEKGNEEKDQRKRYTVPNLKKNRRV